MSLAFYMDVHVPEAITEGLRGKGIDVLTVQEDETTTWTDSDLVDRATELGRVLVSHDADMLQESKRRQESAQSFSGVIYGHQLKLTIGKAVLDLALIAEVMTSEEMTNQLIRLPL